MDTIRIGTRASRLALAQSEQIAGRLREQVAGLRVELVEVVTSGDRIRDVPLGPHLGSSFFTKEIEDALLDGRIDMAVHSCKDLATRLPTGLVIGAIPEREDPRDVLVSSAGTLSDLPAGSTIGTSSPRRRGFLEIARPDVVVHDQRGNVPTRVGAVDAGTVDAVVLAAAGLARLGMADRITEYLDPGVMLPAAAQGALAVQIREGDTASVELSIRLDDPLSRVAVEAERACLRRLQAGCQAPVGAYARLEGKQLVLEAAILTPEGAVRTRVEGEEGASEDVGTRAAEDLLESLGLDSLIGVGAHGPSARDAESRA